MKISKFYLLSYLDFGFFLHAVLQNVFELEFWELNFTMIR